MSEVNNTIGYRVAEYLCTQIPEQHKMAVDIAGGHSSSANFLALALISMCKQQKEIRACILQKVSELIDENISIIGIDEEEDIKVIIEKVKIYVCDNRDVIAALLADKLKPNNETKENDLILAFRIILDKAIPCPSRKLGDI